MYIFLLKSLAKSIFLTKTPENWHFGAKLTLIFGRFLLEWEYLGRNSLKSCKNGLVIRKCCLAQGIRSKTGAAHPSQKFFFRQRNWATGIMANSRWGETGIVIYYPPVRNKMRRFCQIQLSQSIPTHMQVMQVQIWRMSVAYRRRNLPSKLVTGKRVRHFGMP